MKAHTPSFFTTPQSTHKRHNLTSFTQVINLSYPQQAAFFLKQHSAAFLPEPQEHVSFFPQHSPYFLPEPQEHRAKSLSFWILSAMIFTSFQGLRFRDCFPFNLLRYWTIPEESGERCNAAYKCRKIYDMCF